MVQTIKRKQRKQGDHTFLPTQETIPAVTLFCKVRGEPKASTHSPTRMPLLLPSLTAGNGALELILIMARSDTLHHQGNKVFLVKLTIHMLVISTECNETLDVCNDESIQLNVS